ncbi:hypothetical protein Misp01_13910 [Microtetraspora sp. NBRC 13810]|uniref:MFS transporter n=1 Tax=Microtetraspora sp. NBRC 13810 TaxID=3030990 RepID=UPI0024A0948A|nr:MFS transporter [Microtetraspora sp. NBRC 13810]GLW06261.1 hypothetical protein Misp01_13910 [Microtetraspora sp. NBRC 13810]
MPFEALTAASARRRFAVISFLSWLPTGLTIAPMVLLMSERGLSVAEIGLVSAIYSALCIALELPTGGLADVIGRRWTLAASAAFALAGVAMMAFATSLWPFALSAVLRGIGRALSSGPAEAWYVDTLHAVEGPDADLKPGLARGGAMGSVSLAVGVLAGGLIPLLVPDGPVSPLAVPVLASVVASAVLLVAALVTMPEPPRHRTTLGTVLRGVPETVRDGLRLALRDLGLRRLLLISFAFGVALNSIELLTPQRLASLTGQAETGGTLYALVAALGFGAGAAGSALAPAAARLFRGSVGGSIAGVVVMAGAVGALAASVALDGVPGMVATAAAYVVIYAALSAVGVLRSEMMHRRVASGRRATLMSVSSLQLQFGGMTSSLALGWLTAQLGIGGTWGVVAVVVLVSAALFVRLPEVSPARVELPSPAPGPRGRSGSGSRSSA